MLVTLLKSLFSVLILILTLLVSPGLPGTKIAYEPKDEGECLLNIAVISDTHLDGSAARQAVLDILDDETIGRVKEKGAYLRQSIEDMNLPCLGSTRGMGMMIGIAVAEGYSNKELCAKLNRAGLLCITAGPCLRLLPPLTITREEMDKGLAILKETLK